MFACVAGQQVAQHVVAEVEAERGVGVGRAVGEHLENNQIFFSAPNIFPLLHTHRQREVVERVVLQLKLLQVGEAGEGVEVDGAQLVVRQDQGHQVRQVAE